MFWVFHSPPIQAVDIRPLHLVLTSTTLPPHPILPLFATATLSLIPLSLTSYPILLVDAAAHMHSPIQSSYSHTGGHCMLYV
mmetsp:Transcript_29952/g.77317  ORF Transcript_29952/g.77317 Transcript_29952/m.77317 type:complete len:82 (+) Transcript_29952:1828-2073(+)